MWGLGERQGRAIAWWRRGSRDVERDARGSRARVRRDTADAERRHIEDGSRSERAKRVRVTYAVSARDDVDGAVPVSCFPRSGSRFDSGRTDVVCSATDASANTQTARFTITVKRRR
jgi:hypothetical protein